MNRRGFTLVEILITLLVLAIGLPSVIIMVLGCTRMTGATAHRNVAALIIAEAQDDIERLHRITTPSITPVDRSADQGYYIETLDTTLCDEINRPSPPATTQPWPNTVDRWPNITASDSHYGPPSFAFGAGGIPSGMVYQNPNFPNCMMWPPTPDPKYYGGPLIASGGTELSNGLAYRVVYRLERHPEWTRHALSPYAGVYVLTMTVYRDLNPRGNPAPTASDPLKKKLEQVSDPVVVYLRRK